MRDRRRHSSFASGARRPALRVAALAVLGLIPSFAASTPAWDDFVDARSNGTEPMLPDFSWAGYRYSNEPIPDVVGTVFDVRDYGAIADDGASDRAAIIAAIGAAETNGSGIVFFPPGRFHLNTAADAESTIFIEKGNIVLRGSGSGPGGTELFMERNFEAADPNSNSSTPFMFQIQPADISEGTLTTITGSSTRESFSIEVASTSNLSVGQVVTLYLRSTDAVPSFLAPHTADPSWEGLFQEGIQIRERHEIASIVGNTVTFVEPIHVNIDPAFDWQVRRHKFIEELGFEDIAFVGNWKETFSHHLNPLHDGGWSALSIKYVRNGWIRRCRFVDWNYSVYQDSCTAFSILQTSIEGNAGHHSFHSRRGYGVLVGLSRDLSSQWHGPGVGYQNAGAVYWRYEYPGTSSWDSHSDTPYATLLDATTGGMRYGRSGGNQQGLPNHLRWFTLWNFNQTGPAVSNYDFWRSGANTRDRYVNPIVVGFHGASSTFNASHLELLESFGTPVEPESLFEAQLALRLGGAPDWIEDAKNEWEIIQNGLSATLSAPAKNAVYTPLSDVSLSVDIPASIVSGVQSVVYKEGGNPIGTGGAPPFDAVWNAAPAGTYEVAATVNTAVGSFTTPGAVIYVGALPQTEIEPGPISASDEQEPNIAANSHDGDLATRWSAEGIGQWLQFDLGTTRPVNRIDLAWYEGDQRNTSFAIELSNNGTDWNRVLEDASSGTTLGFETHYFTGGPARFVRLIGLGNSINDWNSLTEAAIFSPTPDSTLRSEFWATF